ncbi:hypothetical protein BK133_10935 [Paenibacillus sp. FSL H8-0548]|uniref:hypothetical protein n=1 Tax=Paenibacillus sp. FSL H8-0548 TaxID=1920422 RepID=UPI00096FDB30|nr:hypothetical protein [Paenibacillus sp. FSL H8-0548]OMF35219.1 hypothetical protein BK133_10935 [Paenibacillus sp. FSL H8-0548]
MKINELVKAAHENAVVKGWWQEERTYGELVALMHSEVSEALEDYRNGKQPNEVWYEYEFGGGTVEDFRTELLFGDGDWVLGKPCGIPSELADVCIRIFDAAGKNGWGEALHSWYGRVTVKWRVNSGLSFTDNLNIIHGNLTDCARADSWKEFNLAVVLQNVAELASYYDFDLDQAISEKMAYNATRPERHGGKVI